MNLNQVFTKSSKSFLFGAAMAGMLLTSVESKACGDTPLIGEICTFAFNYCPVGFVKADGALLPVSQNQALFALLGFRYGGDNSTTFAVPDLRGRAAVGVGSAPGLLPVTLGQKTGVNQLTININNLPPHNHGATFTPITGNLAINIPATAKSGTITATATTDVVAGSAGVDPLAGKTYYLTGVTGSANGPVTETQPSDTTKATLAGTTVQVNADTFIPATVARTVNATAVTGGTVAVGSTGAGVPLNTTSPQIGLTYCVATSGTWPQQP